MEVFGVAALAACSLGGARSQVSTLPEDAGVLSQCSPIIRADGSQANPSSGAALSRVLKVFYGVIAFVN